MKSYKVFAYLLIALPALLLQSCLKDDDDKFPESSSERAQKYIAAAQDSLMNSTYGWILDYYPQSSQSYGGYTYAVKFDQDKATVYFENQPGKSETSLYSMKSDDGPVLSFDSYNSMIHFFATPSSDKNNGYEGDFEFVVDSIGHDAIKVHGKRSMNTMYFRRLNEPAADYMNKVISMGDSFGLYAAVGTVGGQQAQMVFDRSSRQVQVAVDTTYFTSAYNFTDKGIKLYEPVTVEGVTVNELSYSDDNLALTADNGTQLAGIYDPSIITEAIGSVGADDNAFTRTFKNLPHLDQFKVVAADDWCTVSANGSTLTVSGTANTTGRMRSTTVYVISKLTNQVRSSFSVKQMNINDILGTYTMQFYDYENTLVKATATIAKSGTNGVTLSFSTQDGDYDWKFTGTYNQSLGAIMLPQLQQVSSWNTSKYGTVYCYNVYGLDTQGSYLFSDKLSLPIYFQSSAKGVTYAKFGSGNLYYNGRNMGSSYNCQGIYMMVSQSEAVSSSSDFLGFFDIWTNGIMARTSTSGAKSIFSQAKSPMKRIQPLSMTRVSDAVKK